MDVFQWVKKKKNVVVCSTEDGKSVHRFIKRKLRGMISLLECCFCKRVHSTGVEKQLFSAKDCTKEGHKRYYCTPLCYMDELTSCRIQGPSWEYIQKVYYDRNDDIYTESDIRMHRSQYKKMHASLWPVDIEDVALEEVEDEV